ncbi:MAG: PEP-CTERM sorting domain-containing protein [Nitrosomonas sp.]|nr:PEP-CTERM sorting domain-containing protein [Nitrosomonas sp.]MDP1949955.1 PEP-CTERM sorting domain-containing protein [Nitrosomonas sp.]
MNKTKICAFLVSIPLAGIPAFVQAQQIAPNPNPLNSTITINGIAENSENFSNAGNLSIENSGILSNSGNLINGIWSTDASNVWDYYGSMTNSGSLINANGSSLITFGYLSSSGILNNSGTLSSGTTNNHAGYLGNSGILTNSVDGNLTAFAYLGNLAGGNLKNYGSLNIGTLDDHTGSLNNFGDLTNFGTLSYSGSLYNPGIFTNQGDLTTYATFGSLTNDGALFNQGTWATGGWLGNNGTLTNSGTLINTGGIGGIGTYTQTAGQTVINGSFSQSSIQILGGSLSGASTITGDVTIGDQANINPGNSPGTLTINGDFYSSGNLVFEIAGLGEYDVLDINGNAAFAGGNVEFNFINDFHASINNYWDFFFADTITGMNSLNFTFNGLGKGLGWDIIHLGNQGERLLITAVPEPEIYAMLLTGLGLMGFMAPRRRKNKQPRGKTTGNCKLKTEL